MEKSFKFKNGATLADKISGFVGVVMGRADHLTGCNRYGLQREGLTDKNQIPSWVWIDESQLVLTAKDRITLDDEPKADPGGPCDASHDPPSN